MIRGAGGLFRFALSRLFEACTVSRLEHKPWLPVSLILLIQLVEVPMQTDTLYPPPPPRTKHGISMKDLDVRIQHLEKEVENLKKRLTKLEK